METNQNIERVYELLEQFDFNELSEQDKLFVLSQITETEYNKMRSTIKDTQTFFVHDIEPIRDNSSVTSSKKDTVNKNLLLHLLKQPIQFYKVAASIVILIGIYSAIQYFNPQGKSNLLTSNDKIYINKTDTVYSKIVDTITIIKERIIYIPKGIEVATSFKLVSNSKNKYDCNKEICPSDIDIIKELANNNNASKDTLLKELIALAN
jgi:hypothetical protein